MHLLRKRFLHWCITLDNNEENKKMHRPICDAMFLLRSCWSILDSSLKKNSRTKNIAAEENKWSSREREINNWTRIGNARLHNPLSKFKDLEIAIVRSYPTNIRAIPRQEELGEVIDVGAALVTPQVGEQRAQIDTIARNENITNSPTSMIGGANANNSAAHSTVERCKGKGHIYAVSLRLNSANVRMLVDTAAPRTLLQFEDWIKIGRPALKRTTIVFDISAS